MTDIANLKQLISDMNIAKIAMNGAEEAHETSNMIVKTTRRNYRKAEAALLEAMEEKGWGCIKINNFMVYRSQYISQLRIVPIDRVMEYEWKE